LRNESIPILVPARVVVVPREHLGCPHVVLRQGFGCLSGGGCLGLTRGQGRRDEDEGNREG
jgi:hypothetical protein